MDLQINTVYHNLYLLKRCGGGAFGEVYYCRDLSGRHLAVKIISKSRLGDAWERELRGVTNYRTITENAPELLQIYHVGEDGESFYYTMEAADSLSDEEYIPDTLAGRLAGGALPPDTLLPVLRDILGGITAIHQAGFTHRDIKPDNIIFVKGKPKIGDIGLVSSLSATMTQIAGTLDFLPPEQRTAEGSDSSDRESRQRSDLYAFGKVIYCAATGQSPHAWPTIPRDTALSLPLKFFIRLSFRLCDREPARRLDSLPGLVLEIAAIERKLLYGESFKDKCGYTLKSTARNFGANCRLGARWSAKHWLMLLMLALTAGCATWYYWPKPAFDITKQKTKQYVNPDLKLSMTIPFQWEVVSEETIKKMLEQSAASDEKNNPLEQKRNQMLMSRLQFGANLIFCDYDQNSADNIAIQIVPIPGKSFSAISDEELRHQMREIFQGQLQFNTEIYEVKRMTLAGYPCIYIDLSHDPEVIRINNYVIALKDKCVSIELTAKKTSFPQRREQFESILKTLKIDK